jgi:hypothetical protein
MCQIKLNRMNPKLFFHFKLYDQLFVEIKIKFTILKNLTAIILHFC